MNKLVAGNWKMNGTLASGTALARDVVAGASDVSSVDVVLCPPSVQISPVVTILASSSVAVGGQDCSEADSGAYTGDVAASMLADVGCRYVILGHSERRHGHGETDMQVAGKARRAHAAGLITIICVGETELEREAGRANDVVGDQLLHSLPETATAENTVIAYEPVWAIGTGKTATPEDVREMHAFIRDTLTKKLANSAGIRILYGGSVKPDNAVELMAVPNVDGALVGGASLKADSFLAIVRAAA